MLTAIYRCPTCNDLLEVTHDLDVLRARSAGSWMRLFDERYKRTTWPYGSAVWGKKEWVCPDVADDNIVSMDEGGTNLFWAERFGREVGLGDLWVKLCGNSHTGSFKDLGMTVLVSIVREMMQRGAAIRAVACASTGDTSASLAAYAAAGGIPAIVILPRGKVSTAQLVQPLANGATVLALDTDFDGCMAIVKRLATEEGIYLANSMNSVRLEGQKTVGHRDRAAVRLGGSRLRHHPRRQPRQRQRPRAGFDMMEALGVTARRPRIVVAQAAAANPLYRAYRNDWRSSRFAPPRPRRRRSRSATPSPSTRPSARCSATTASWSRPPRPSWPTLRPVRTGRACTTARTPAWRSPCS